MQRRRAPAAPPASLGTSGRLGRPPGRSRWSEPSGDVERWSAPATAQAPGRSAATTRHYPVGPLLALVSAGLVGRARGAGSIGGPGDGWLAAPVAARSAAGGAVPSLTTATSYPPNSESEPGPSAAPSGPGPNSNGPEDAGDRGRRRGEQHPPGGAAWRQASRLELEAASRPGRAGPTSPDMRN